MDIFVAPKRKDAFGKTLAEAIACGGTPRISFDGTDQSERHRRSLYMKKSDYIPPEFISRLLVEHDISVDKNNEYPRISIVMPSFNQAVFIERSILSVINQNYPKLEFIIIDGGSSDGTIDIIKKYKSYLAYWVSEPDAGQSDALNKGFAHATGEIFGWLNSDDVYLPNAFQKIVHVFTNNSSKSIVFGDWLSIDKHDQIIDLGYAFDFNLMHLEYEGWHLHPQSLFWRRNVHLRFGKFDSDLHTNMDYQMVLCFARNEGKSHFDRVPEPLGCWRRHDGQKTGHRFEQAKRETHKFEIRYGLKKKHTVLGKLIRLTFRARRAYWYLKRGGPAFFLKRLREAYGPARLH